MNSPTGSAQMKENLTTQFNNLRELIITSVQTLRGLVAQSKELEKLAAKLRTEPASSDSAASVEEIRTSIDKSISEMVERTEKLFEAYTNIVNELNK